MDKFGVSYSTASTAYPIDRTYPSPAQILKGPYPCESRDQDFMWY